MASKVLSGGDLVVIEGKSLDAGSSEWLQSRDFIVRKIDLLEEQEHSAFSQKYCVFDLVFRCVESEQVRQFRD